MFNPVDLDFRMSHKLTSRASRKIDSDEQGRTDKHLLHTLTMIATQLKCRYRESQKE
jgi:hypothetical protein